MLRWFKLMHLARLLHGQQCTHSKYKCLFQTYLYVFVYLISLESFRCMTFNCAERTGKIYDLLEVIVIKLLCVSVFSSACNLVLARRCLRNAWVDLFNLSLSLSVFPRRNKCVYSVLFYGSITRVRWSRNENNLSIKLRLYLDVKQTLGRCVFLIKILHRSDIVGARDGAARTMRIYLARNLSWCTQRRNESPVEIAGPSLSLSCSS